MHASETVEITGHLIDTGILSRVLDDVREYGGDWVIDKFDVGHEAADLSSARITISTDAASTSHSSAGMLGALCTRA